MQRKITQAMLCNAFAIPRSADLMLIAPSPEGPAECDTGHEIEPGEYIEATWAADAKPDSNADYAKGASVGELRRMLRRAWADIESLERDLADERKRTGRESIVSRVGNVGCVVCQATPPAQTFMLNETHETHLTKSQAKRQRAQAKEPK
jgi:hypothetical protein